MKKFASLLLAAVLLATMLCVFALPASAEEGPGSPNIAPPMKETVNLVGQWIEIPIQTQTSGDYKARYGYFIEQDDEYLYYDTYILYNRGVYKPQIILNIRNTALLEGKTGDMTIIPAESVPEAIRNRAAQDYPDLVPTGSTLSEGSLTIIVGIAAAVVFGLGGFILGKAAGKKKKPAVADGTDKADEE